MTELFEAILLGIVQGLTEWFPVSSSGHLALIEFLMGSRTNLLFDILLHWGTLCVIVAKFWQDIEESVKDLIKGDIDGRAARRGLLIIPGNIPTIMIGFAFQNQVRESFDNPFIIGTAFMVSGLILHLAGNQKTSQREIVKFSDSLLIGFAQGVSIIPGISRSGITISTALLIGLNREEAFKYSFLLSIPAVVGALLLETISQPTIQLEYKTSLSGFFVAIGVGYISLSLLWKIIQRRQFQYFKYYCWSIGLITVLIALFRR